MIKLIPANFNNVHHMILEWKEEFLSHGFIIFLLWMSAIGLVCNGFVLIVRLLAMTGVIVVE